MQLHKPNLTQKKTVAELPNVSQAQTGVEHDVWEILHRMMADEPQVCRTYAYTLGIHHIRVYIRYSLYTRICTRYAAYTRICTRPS